jgi:hypothetical protein
MTDKIDPAVLSQKWVHSHEEDTADEMVFRPASHPFPPSRGRKAFQLDPDGRLLNFAIGPDDRTFENEGRWQLDSSNKLTLEPANAGATTSVMRLLHVDRDKLVVKK